MRNIMGELAIIFGICLAGEGIAAALPFSFPASVIAMLLLLGLLLSGVIKERHIGRVCRFLMGNMAFFFLPSCVSIMRHWDALSAVLVPFFLISLLTVPLVYGAAGLTVQLVRKLMKGGVGK